MATDGKGERSITVIDLDDPEDPTKFKLDSKGRLSLHTFRTCFPGAVGLKYYDKNGDVCAVNIENDHFVIESEKDDDYYAFYGKKVDKKRPIYERNKPMVESLLSKIQDNRMRVREITGPNKESAKNQLKRKSSELSNSELSAKARKMKYRSFSFGWVHKNPGQLTFKAVGPPFGGFVSFELDMDRNYTAAEIREMVIEKFKNEKNKYFMDSLYSIKLGLHTGQTIESFKTDDVEEDNLWDFVAFHRISNKQHFYIVSEEKKKEIAENKTTTANEFLLPASSDCNVANISNPATLERKVVMVDVATQTSNYNLLINCSTQTDFANSISASENNMHDDDKNKVEHPSQIESNSDNLFKENETFDESNSALSLAADETGNNPNLIRVYYCCVKKSEYSGMFSVSDLSKKDLFDELQANEPLGYTLENFDPYSNGFHFSTISRGTDVLLEITTDEKSLNRCFKFPLLGHVTDYHQIIYDCDVLKCTVDGKFGYGVIPSCTDHCNPVFSWYVNEKLYKEGKFLYWIELDEDHADVRCVVGCSQVNPSVQAQMTDENGGLPLIEKKDFTIGNQLLGAGAQGTVKKGEYLGTKVAVKTIVVLNDNVLKDISNEMSVIKVVRHPNIVQVLGVCVDNKKIHILMELFSSISLHDILFDDDVDFELTLPKKDLLAKQICLAVAYLHGQKPQILHRDIKPENILVNEYGVLKLGDLGMSKVCQPAALLRTTAARGTYLYMAPELAVKHQPASANSDVWSVACTLVELYSQKSIWHEQNFKSEKDLTRALENGYKPSLDNVPEGFKPILEKCFSINSFDRPDISLLLKFYDELAKEEE